MASNPQRDYWEILGIAPGSTVKEIEEAYYRIRYRDKFLKKKVYETLRYWTSKRSSDPKYRAQFPTYQNYLEDRKVKREAKFAADEAERAAEKAAMERYDAQGHVHHERRRGAWRKVDSELSLQVYRQYQRIGDEQEKLRRVHGYSLDGREKSRRALERAREEHRRLGERALREWKKQWMPDGDTCALGGKWPTLDKKRVAEYQHKERETKVAGDVAMMTYDAWEDLYWHSKFP